MSNTNLEFSKMTLSDFVEIKPILSAEFDDFWNESTLENELSSNNSYYVVAKQNFEIVGFAGLKYVLDEADIMNIVTKKSKRNLGIGTLLLKELLQFAKQNNIKTLTLEVNENNLPAIHLYEKLGFKRIAERKKYYQNTYDAIIMQINL
jgi:ribosomal-protein-alanine N-acetyltransferase